eukprot:CAMPEP_0206579178 /NCGR_PEP_ID=MMETSP0325_2-20121206/32401_1 /ASSEMBLY_ACC=CAM_ASM_000347 /TAXON_ID=2866 /ORGANISM="Crypthecodinium cohnii, Strain Seligo" /LENGTH=84 /DNA_ID=CAMNT_0054084953 /DNA_START=45 /DNA_END=295 /DNA_ORIENTATION=-
MRRFLHFLAFCPNGLNVDETMTSQTLATMAAGSEGSSAPTAAAIGGCCHHCMMFFLLFFCCCCSASCQSMPGKQGLPTLFPSIR